MDQSEESAIVLEGVIQALQEEKRALQTKLDTETDITLRERMTSGVATDEVGRASLSSCNNLH